MRDAGFPAGLAGITRSAMEWKHDMIQVDSSGVKVYSEFPGRGITSILRNDHLQLFGRLLSRPYFENAGAGSKPLLKADYLGG